MIADEQSGRAIAQKQKHLLVLEKVFYSFYG